MSHLYDIIISSFQKIKYKYKTGIRKLQTFYLLNHISILRFSILRYCRTTSLIYPVMTNAKDERLVEQRIVLCHCNKGNRYSSSWTQTCSSTWKGDSERRIVTRGYLHLRPLPVLLVDRLSTIRPRGWMHGAETPRGHRLPVLAERPSEEIPFRTGNCHYLRWLGGFFLHLPRFLSCYAPVRDTIYVATVRYREW